MAAVSAAPGAAPSAQGPGVASACAPLCVRVVLCCVLIAAGIIRQPCWTLPGPQKRGFVVVLKALLLAAAGAGGVRRGDAAAGRAAPKGRTQRGPVCPGPGRAGWQRQPGASRRTSQKHAPVCFTPPACTFSERLPPRGLSGADVAAHPCPPSRKDPRGSAQHGRSGTGSPGRDGAGRDGTGRCGRSLQGDAVAPGMEAVRWASPSEGTSVVLPARAPAPSSCSSRDVPAAAAVRGRWARVPTLLPPAGGGQAHAQARPDGGSPFSGFFLLLSFFVLSHPQFIISVFLFK